MRSSKEEQQGAGVKQEKSSNGAIMEPRSEAAAEQWKLGSAMSVRRTLRHTQEHCLPNMPACLLLPGHPASLLVPLPSHQLCKWGSLMQRPPAAG